MTPLEIVFLVVIAGVSGAIGKAVAGGSRGSLVANVGVGFIGALIGLWLARQLGLPELLTVTVEDTSFPIAWSVLGSAIFVFVVTLLGGGNKGKKR